VTKAPTFNEVFQWLPTFIDSIRKNTVAATIEMEMIQKEIATGSFGSRNPAAWIFASKLLACLLIVERYII
jgi:hypothetical protein